jgi:gamma-glutamyltranspeptidase/glutathione hydrolase
MRSRPAPGQRDLTEMTPTILLREGRPVLVVGASGSARIPGAILQVISNVLDRGFSLERAMAAPRIYAQTNKVRMHEDFPATVVDALRARGFEIDLRPRGITRHLGIVHAGSFDPESGVFVGVADGVYDGMAAGPRSAPTPREQD